MKPCSSEFAVFAYPSPYPAASPPPPPPTYILANAASANAFIATPPRSSSRASTRSWNAFISGVAVTTVCLPVV